MTTGERIRELRSRYNISQVDLAEQIGVTKQTLYKYEHDIIDEIPKAKIEAIAKVFDVQPEYLLGWMEGRKEYSYEDFMKKILPDNERIIIEAYRNADDYTRRMVEYVLHIKEITDADR